MIPRTLLIADDDVLLARLLKANLEQPGRIAVEVVPSGDDALARLDHGGIDLLFADVAMPGMSGIELVQRARGQCTDLPIVLMTAYATVELAVQGIRAGAIDFLRKPVNIDAMLELVERTIAPRLGDVAASPARRAGATASDCVVGDDPALDVVRRAAERLAAVPGARILITGESGTGKSMLARAIHDLSGDTGRFVEVNCAALPAPLLESELFGYERGAFTGAKGLKHGLIERSHGGTLLLDEIGALPLDLQAKLLQVLETRRIRRVGGIESIPVRMRLIAATNEDLRAMVRQRLFRQDLLFRLDVASVHMPALRTMPGVVAQLTARFLRDAAVELRRPVPPLTDDAIERLQEYPWPGNARELRNAIERALIFHDDGPIRIAPPPADLPEALAPVEGVLLERGLTLGEVERRYIEAMLAMGPTELGEVANRLGISRKTLWEKRRRYGL